MYKCHKCDLETKQLNGLMTKHWKIHCSDSYSKEQYKADLLSYNGRPLNSCKICQLPVPIPKGEAVSPSMHKYCYLKNTKGENNPNWSGGKTIYSCRYCNSAIEKHSSLVLVENPFCSTSCSMNFYALPENRTEAQIESDRNGAITLREAMKTDKFKEAHAIALAKMQEDKKSRVEQRFLEAVQAEHKDAIGSHVMDFYTWDTFIPSTNELFEVQGNYWHNMADTRVRDQRKSNFLKNNRPEYKLHTIWENEINDLKDIDLLNHARHKPRVLILSGPSGCGKSYIGNMLQDKYNVIEYDEVGYDGCIKACKNSSNLTKLIITPFQAKKMSSELRVDGIRNWCLYLQENREVIVNRLEGRGTQTGSVDNRMARFESLKDKIFQYYGNQQDIIEWLMSFA